METELTIDKRAVFDAGIKDGKSVKELILECGIPKSTAYQWANASKSTPPNEDEAPQGIAPPSVTTTGRGRGRKLTSRPISEEAAGQLCAGMFFIGAALTNEPEVLLTDTERASLAGPAADSLRVLPAPFANAVNTYSAPMVFGTTLAAIVMKKVRIIEQKKLRNVTPGAPRAAVAQPPPNMQHVSQPPRSAAAPGAPPPAASNITDVRAAMDAAKSSLAGLDDPDNGAAAFG